ncbi:carbamate kinase [Halobellus litoreus]|uniref:Carbamate kinase n=1 Tax=Halobellus litoreus TaxID=755310 RepID=A0ABD6DVI7_9EURY|nr:carbamate kinase [Halobellus litoreus]
MDGSAPDRRTGPVVVALGGNTLLGKQGPWTVDEQTAAIERTAREISEAIEDGYEIVLTHGNGPQVGTLLLQQETASETPQLPLDVLVAETQAQIGYLLQQALDNELTDSTDFITIVTQVVVDGDDPAFADPTKPIGPFYTEEAAAEKPFETKRVSTGDRPYRRVVPSPEPVEIVEGDEIANLVHRGNLVIAAGGGGVPVVRDDGLSGVEAVVDKDTTTRLLASELGVGTLVLLTDVEFAYVNYDTPDQRPIREVTARALRTHLEAGEFGAGSMRPKVEACLQFVEEGGDRAVITSPDRLLDALAGETGTQVRG